LVGDDLRERGDPPTERGELGARRTARRTVRALAEVRAAAERAHVIRHAAVVVAKERAAALVRDRQAARPRRRAVPQRFREERPLDRPELRLATRAAEVAAVCPAIAAPARGRALHLPVKGPERVP